MKTHAVCEEAWLDLNADAGLEERCGTSETGGGGFGVELANGGDGLAGVAAQLGDAAVELGGEGDAIAVEWEDGADTGDGLGETECGLACGNGVGAEAVEVEAVERGGLGVEIEDGRDLDGGLFLFCCGRTHDDANDAVRLRQAIGCEVAAGAPGAVRAGDGVGVGSRGATRWRSLCARRRRGLSAKPFCGARLPKAMCRG